MPKTKTKRPDDTRSQGQKFIDAARERGADVDEAEARRALREIAKAPVEKPKKGVKFRE